MSDEQIELPFVEFAVSHGEGTLLEYGVDAGRFEMPLWPETSTIIARKCDENCETGK